MGTDEREHETSIGVCTRLVPWSLDASKASLRGIRVTSKSHIRAHARTQTRTQTSL